MKSLRQLIVSIFLCSVYKRWRHGPINNGEEGDANMEAEDSAVSRRSQGNEVPSFNGNNSPGFCS